MSGNNQDSYKFNEFRLDVGERLLVRDNLSVPLTPKVFDVLAVLVERSGHLVEKDEVLQIVWQDAFVEQSTVARAVHTLRKVLGEDSEHKFIETVAKKGYRFVAAVEKNNDCPAQESDNQIPSTVAEQLLETDIQIPPSAIAESNVPVVAKPKQTTRIILIAVGFLSMISLISLLAFNYQSNTSVNSNAPKSIAVLPVKPISTENRDPIYELGIAESLITKLSSVKDLKVRPLSATRKYIDIEQDAIAAGREQQVDYVLASNYQITDGKIRVTSQLINVQTGATEETLRSDKDTADKLLMQDTIAYDFGNKLLKQFGKTENTQTAKRGTTNEEAYRLYLKAEYIFEEFNEPEIGKAIKYLEQAVKLDQNYAAAYVQLAYAYQCYQFIWSKNIPSEKEYYLKSKEAIEKALALDENSADAHAVLGLIKSGYERDFVGAEKEYQRAIDLDPDSGMAHGLYSLYLMSDERFDEALDEGKIAIDIDPTYVANDIAYGMILYNAHRYPEAYAHFKKMLEKNENDYHPYNWLWIICAAQGNEQEAYEWFIKYQYRTQPEPIPLYQKAYQKAGWKGILHEMIKQNERIVAFDNDPDCLYIIACFNANLGNKDKAFEYLDRAYERRRSSLNWIKIDPSLEWLHDDPRFDELVRRVGLN